MIAETPERPKITDAAARPTVVLGAGPAGLTAAYLLAKQGRPVLVAVENRLGVRAVEVRREHEPHGSAIANEVG